MKPLKVCIVTYSHQRFDMLELHLACTKRLAHKYGAIPIVVNSIEYPCRELVEKYGAEYHEHPNKAPYKLGKKANHAIIIAGLHDPDYVMVLDSDDIISDTFYEVFLDHMEQGYDVIGVRDLYFWSLHHKRSSFNVFGYYPGRGTRITGVAKTMSADVLRQLDWMPFNRRVNSGLDGTMLARTRKKGASMVSLIQKDYDMFGIDIKSGGNINGIGNFKIDRMAPEATLRKYLPDNEVDDIMRFAQKVYKQKWGRDYAKMSQNT